LPGTGEYLLKIEPQTTQNFSIHLRSIFFSISFYKSYAYLSVGSIIALILICVFIEKRKRNKNDELLTFLVFLPITLHIAGLIIIA